MGGSQILPCLTLAVNDVNDSHIYSVMKVCVDVGNVLKCVKGRKSQVNVAQASLNSAGRPKGLAGFCCARHSQTMARGSKIQQSYSTLTSTMT
eukprot:3566648-Rhodomonas_salina.1